MTRYHHSRAVPICLLNHKWLTFHGRSLQRSLLLLHVHGARRQWMIRFYHLKSVLLCQPTQIQLFSRQRSKISRSLLRHAHRAGRRWMICFHHSRTVLLFINNRSQYISVCAWSVALRNINRKLANNALLIFARHSNSKIVAMIFFLYPVYGQTIWYTTEINLRRNYPLLTLVCSYGFSILWFHCSTASVTADYYLFVQGVPMPVRQVSTLIRRLSKMNWPRGVVLDVYLRTEVQMDW